MPAVKHALDGGGLLTADAIVLPASATVYIQAVELRSGEVCGLDMSAANLYRWHPAYAAGVPLAHQGLGQAQGQGKQQGCGVVALSEPQEVWHFDLGAPPERSDVKTLDIEFTQ